MKDLEIRQVIAKEEKRQKDTLELIASENFASDEVRRMMASCLTNKYAEGYPGSRYYGGCEYIDEIEQLAINRACMLFNCSYANVQPHSGSQANAIAYRALEAYLIDNKLLVTKDGRKRKMKILTMDLNSGSHLSHGSSVSFSSHIYDFYFFNLGLDGKLDYDIIKEAATKVKPDVILSGYSAYPYEIDFSKFRQICDEVNCLFMVDMAHIAGLVAVNEHPSPFPHADIVTSTTHKTLRGPRGGLVLTNRTYLTKYIDKANFPYYQGGPLEHVIAAKAVCFNEANTLEFAEYIRQVKLNTRVFSLKLQQLGVDCTCSENHLTLINTKKSFDITGIEAQKLLEDIGITTNRNMLPNDTEKPSVTSGLRIGFAALTTRGCKEKDATDIANIIYCYLKLNKYTDIREEYRAKVKSIVRRLK